MRVRGDTSICRAPVFNEVEDPRFLGHVCVVGVCICALLVYYWFIIGLLLVYCVAMVSRCRTASGRFLFVDCYSMWPIIVACCVICWGGALVFYVYMKCRARRRGAKDNEVGLLEGCK